MNPRIWCVVVNWPDTANPEFKNTSDCHRGLSRAEAEEIADQYIRHEFRPSVRITTDREQERAA